MHVQFEFTQEDMIDTSKRFLERSEAVRAWRLKGMLLTAVLGWSVVFLILLFTGHPPINSAIFGLIVAVASGFMYPGFNRRAVDKKLRELHQETLGDAAAYLCEVELTPVGVWVKQMNTQIIFEWESVEEITESAESVDIFTRTGGVIVRNRAFATAETRREFTELARGYLELSHTSDAERQTQLTNG